MAVAECSMSLVSLMRIFVHNHLPKTVGFMFMMTTTSATYFSV